MKNTNDNSAIYLNFDTLESWKRANPESENVLLNDHNDPEIISAKKC